ncbi:norsolorinic acid reductase [Niveomyces insectorum RCEF 264]|uniref:Norsolorinic acid reductase n=1 Tax=Niveomyces insectorum RCEF 264 TaxID=1081102 RepID=A0A167USM6_9HYPO|nr:norsolorinic acid reductase [Niveomyces insectorum RCEF 264]
MAFAPPPAPKSALGRYRLLSPSASVRVSPLCLGGMNFGDAWAVCNFIDTANNYQNEESEAWIGDWMKKRGNRDQMVIATKYTTCYRGHTKEILANSTGNSTKSLHVSVNNSLKKLQTDYIDLLYVHWWDYSTSIPELMQSLNQLVTAGKVLYLGVSDTPAWVVSKANEYARNHGLRPFSVYQGLWSAATRDFEREIIPLARDEGLALAPWGALGGGAFHTEAQRRARAETKEGRQRPPTEKQIAVSRVLESVASRKNTQITSVALAYVMQKTTYVFPIVGGRTIEHLKGNIEALSLTLSDEDIAEIESAVPFELGFPHDVFSFAPQGSGHYQEAGLLGVAGKFDYVPVPRPITLAQESNKADGQ